ncbi:MAG: PAS domain-containing protein, partial [Chloroflexales bacterium]|nr:PAS domain-containing protein [Chloroflexales bacterium]
RRAEALVAAQRDLARILATATDPQVAWPHCLELGLQITEMDCGGIYLFDAYDRVLEMVSHQGLAEAFLQRTMRYPIDTPHARLMLSGQAVYLSTEETRRRTLFRTEGLTSVAIMPIRHQGQVLGCVNLASHTLPQVPPWARNALETIATEIGNIVVVLRTASALRESQLRMELVLKGSNLGMWDWEMQTGRGVCNERWATIVGYTLAELAPVSVQTWIDLCHPEDLQRAVILQQQHVAGETEFYEVEIRMRHKDGSWVWVSSRGQVVAWDAAGVPVRMVGTHRDITARKQAELTLRELNESLERSVAERTAALQVSQERLTLATRSAGIGIWDWDIVTNSVTWDQRMYELYGVTPETFGSAYEAWLNGLHPDDRAEAERVSLRTRRGEQAYDTEFRVCHPDGAVRVLKAHAMVQRGPGGEPLRMIGVNFDITERKRVELALREGEERYRTLVEYMTQGVIVYQDGRVVFCNAAATAIIGCADIDLLGCSVADLAVLLHADDAAGLHTWLEAELLGVSTYSTPFHFSRVTDGQLCWLVSDATATSYHGRPAVLVMLSDVTALKLAEEQLRQANLEMIRAARMKDEFLANMSHELRSPLNAILGFSESLQDEIYGPLSERQHTAMRHVETSGQHLLALITDILDLSKVEAGRMSLAVERVRLAEVCQASLLFVKGLATKKSLRLNFVLSDPAAHLEADPKRLKQILVNLLSNAVKFTPDGGQVGLEVTPDDAAGEVRFAVRDTGIGIAPEDLMRLFQPFVQLDSSLSRQHEGTGLGLALVRRLAELHGGTVLAESEPGVGSCFTLVLPQHPSVPGAEPQPVVAPTEPIRGALDPVRVRDPGREPGAASARILLAEDNEANILTTSDYLQARGFAVSVARTGPEALAAAVAHQPDLILMDVQLPELDGLALTRQLRVLPAFVSTPIIALTALTMPHDRERCLAAGANAYLSKPVRLKELVTLIDQLLQG